jgi:serine/threonine-protein kinase
MGVVYLAHEVALDRPVALKLLPAAMAVDPALRERFMREARTAAKLSQPNIVPIHAVDQVADLVFFTMAYVEGESLGETIRRRGALGGDETSRILREVAWALAYAHAQGVVHRDVKPDNILLETGSGRALVTDFGIAQVSGGRGLTERGEILGTAEFMSPEQASGEAVNEQSDIYSLGVVGFYALTGQLPFQGETVSAILAKHITQAAPPVHTVAPEAPRHLAGVIDRCLAKAPDDRFEDGEALAAALARSLELRRDMPVPLRAFINRNREQLRGLPLVGILVAEGAAITGVGFAAGEAAFAAMGSLMVFAIGSAPAGMLLRMCRQLLAAGHTHAELIAAFREDLHARRQEQVLEEGPRRGWLDRLASGLWFGGLGSMAVGTTLAVLLDLNSVSSAVLSGVGLLTGGGFVAVMAGLPIRAVRGGGPGGLPGSWWAKFWESRPGRGLFKLAGVGLKRIGVPEAPYRHTEVAIGMAADRLYRELPKATRKALPELPDVVARLERYAQEARGRVEELSELTEGLDVGGKQTAAELDERRGELANDLADARGVAEARLRDAVTALETIRLDLLRMHAGTGTVEGITQDLSLAQDIVGDIERLLDGHAAVEQVLSADTDGPRPDAASADG